MTTTDAQNSDLGFSDPNPRAAGVLDRLPGIVIPVVSVLLAFAIGGILIWFQGVNPLTAYKVLFTSALGSEEGLLRVMEKSTPLILTGLAVTVGLRAGLFNIGAQGRSEEHTSELQSH